MDVNLKGKEIEQEIGIYALRRSGHHGVISWLCRHYSGWVFLANNIEKKSTKNKISCLNLRKLESGKEDNSQNPEKLRAIIWNFENGNLEPLSFTDANHKYLVIIRDPLNWLASRLKASEKVKEYETLLPTNLYKIYLSQFQQLTKETEHLPYSSTLCINFNKWFSNKKYRDSIGKKLDFQNLDKGLNRVENAGSSFDSFEYDKKAQKMSVLTRYRVYKEDSNFMEALSSYPELLKISRGYFGVSI